MNGFKDHSWSRVALAVAGIIAAPMGAVAAQAGTPADDGQLEQVVVTGTRRSDIKAIDSPAPVQVVSEQELESTPTTPGLIQTLASLVPSLDTTRFGGDLSNLTLQAALRSLSPNDTLILINGKRRHTTSNIGIQATGSFGGGAGVDLNFIPSNAIERIEVLTDGAAAQYGSDAIAGVINIILKKGSDGGNLQASYGAFQDGGGDANGATTTGVVTYYTTRSGVKPITNIDIGYELRESLQLSVGAENVFNTYPNRVNSQLLSAYQAGGYSFAATQYANGPIGINGGYYYLKAAYRF